LRRQIITKNAYILLKVCYICANLIDLQKLDRVIVKKRFNPETFKIDAKAGIATALISLPVGISIAVVSGVNPMAGMSTSFWAGLAGAFLGGSSFNIFGVTGAFIGVVATTAMTYGPEVVPALAIFAGIFMLAAYLFSLERYLILIPSSAIHGFILGVACTLIISQFPFALGLKNLPRHDRLIYNAFEALKHVSESSLHTVALFSVCYALLIFFRRYLPSIPGAIIVAPLGILVGYIASKGIIPFQFETLATKFGKLETSFLKFFSGPFELSLIKPAVVIALVGIIETLLSAKVADVYTRTKHNSKKELFGLGIANIVSGFFGGLPASAALGRTVFNVKAGAVTSFSILASSLFIFVACLLFLPLFSYIPLAVIAAILINVAINMVEREQFTRLFKHDKMNFAIAVLVAVITVYEDPIVGILAGSVVALLLLVNALAESFHEVELYKPSIKNKEMVLAAEQEHILVYSIKGKLVYINSEAHMLRFQDFAQYVAIVLNLEDLYYIDFDGIKAIEEIIRLTDKRGQPMALVRPKKQIEAMLVHSDAYRELEKRGLVFDSIKDALVSEEERISQNN
jgi:sulfate permease, SulP family